MTKTSKTIATSGRPRFVFFGSGPVAAESLRLLMNDFSIEAVVTKPATQTEMQSIASPDTPVHAVGTRKELDALMDSRPFSSELAVLIDFGIIVSQKVIDYFPLGIINSHFSRLPELRGADPITFAILSGQQQTGVSLMLLVEAMDEGPLLAQRTCTITDDETAVTLTDKLVQMSNALLKENIPRYVAGDLKPYPQQVEEITPTYTRKLTKEDGILDFTKPAAQLEREIRAFIDWPKSRTQIAGKDVIITKAYVAPHPSSDKTPGEVGVVTETKSLYITTTNESLWIEYLKPAGKKEMTAEAFFAGHKNLLQ